MPPFQDKFYPKTWTDWSVVILFGMLAVIGLTGGPLLFLGWIEPANGKPGRTPGIVISIFGLVLLLLMFSLWARIRSAIVPVIALFHEGAVLRVEGPRRYLHDSSLLRALRQTPILDRGSGLWAGYLRLRWKSVVDAQVSGGPMTRRLIVVAALEPDPLLSYGPMPPTHVPIQYMEDVFKDRVDTIADTIRFLAQGKTDPSCLPSWDAPHTVPTS
jgi:hypothetical protein